MRARLASVPVVYVRLGGARDDAPHVQAFRAARALLAPFAAPLDDPATPDWVRTRTRYAPGLVARPAATPVDPRSVVVVIGAGGAMGDGEVWARAARAVPDRVWTVIGPCAPARDPPANLMLAGWVEDADARIAGAGVVVGGAGDGVVGAVLAARRPFVCLAEDRPFGEQRAKAARLVAVGAAIACDDAAIADWGALMMRAAAIGPAASAALDDPDGAARTAAYLIALADGTMPA